MNADALAFPRELSAGRRPTRTALTLPDGYETAVYAYPPVGGGGRLPVVYLHGIQSHPGWFCGSAAALAEAGHWVFQPTRRGSGEDARDRGHAASARQLLGDVRAACRFALERSGSARLHLLGVSWGGKLAAAFILSRLSAAEVASLTLVAPGIVPRVDLPLRTKLAVGLCALVRPRKRFDIPLNDVELFTDNEAMRAYLRADRFRLRRATARFLLASRQLDLAVAWAPKGAVRIPTTLILARRDRIIDNAGTRRVLDRLTAGGALVEEFDAAHTIEFEPDPRAFYESLRTAASREE